MTLYIIETDDGVNALEYTVCIPQTDEPDPRTIPFHQWLVRGDGQTEEQAVENLIRNHPDEYKKVTERITHSVTLT